MISHFQWKSLFKSTKIPGWTISFYFKGVKYNATYNKDGSIDWSDKAPEPEHVQDLTKQIHELMLFHVYD